MSSRSRTWLAIYARALAHMASGGAPADPPRRILLAHHSLLGDTILLGAVTAKLRHLHPDARLVHVMPRAFVPLFSRRPWGVEAAGWSVRDPASLEALWALGPSIGCTARKPAAIWRCRVCRRHTTMARAALLRLASRLP